MVKTPQTGIMSGLYWVAVKELNLFYHNWDYCIWFLDYGNVV